MSPAARRLLRLGRGARLALGATGALAAVSAACILAQAALLAHVLAQAFLHGAGAGDLRTPLVALVAVLGVRALAAGGMEAAGRLGALSVMSTLRRRLADHLLSGAPLAAAGERSGELATMAVQGVDALETWYARYLPQVLLSALVPPAILVFLLPRDATAAAVLAVTVPVLVVFLVLVGLAARVRVQARWRALRLLGAHFSDVVQGLPTLRAHRREQAQEAVLADVGERLRRETMGTLSVAFLSAFVLELGATIGTALVAATVGLQLVAGHVSLEAGLTVLLLAPELYAPLRGMGQQHHASEEATVAAERIFEVLDRPGVEHHAGGPAATGTAPDPARHGLELEAVAFAHAGRDEPVLRGATLQVAPGETVALVGPSGVGKSTLAALVLRFLAPDEGRLRCGARDLADVDPEAWRRRVAWVPQRPTLLRGTVAENVRLLVPDATDGEVRRALAEAGVLEDVERLPEGIHTHVGDGGRRLSAGQGQRLALARAFLADRPLLVLDEPTAHLDARTAAELDRAIARLAAGRTTLLVVHRPELAALADRVVELTDGVLVARPAALELAA